jgi:hypothetical protein
MNYTHPDSNKNDKPEDWLFTSLVLTQALGQILAPNQGIFIKLKGDVVNLSKNIKKVIVWNNGKQISIIGADERMDLKNGDRIEVITRYDLMN